MGCESAGWTARGQALGDRAHSPERGRPHSQHDPRDVQPHRDAPVFEGGGNEAAEGERRHHAQREGEQGVRARQDRVHRGDLPSGAPAQTPGLQARVPAADQAPPTRAPGAHVPGARPAAPPPFRSSGGSAHASTHWDTPTARPWPRWKAVLSVSPPIRKEHGGWVLPGRGTLLPPPWFLGRGWQPFC